jgi:hypothetical protein
VDLMWTSSVYLYEWTSSVTFSLRLIQTFKVDEPYPI